MRKEKLAFSILNKTASLLDDLKGRRHTHCMVDRIRGRDISLVVKVSCSIYPVDSCYTIDSDNNVNINSIARVNGVYRQTHPAVARILCTFNKKQQHVLQSYFNFTCLFFFLPPSPSLSSISLCTCKRKLTPFTRFQLKKITPEVMFICWMLLLSLSLSLSLFAFACTSHSLTAIASLLSIVFCVIFSHDFLDCLDVSYTRAHIEYSYDLQARIFDGPKGNDSDSCYSTVYHLIRLYIEKKKQVESEEKEGERERKSRRAQEKNIYTVRGKRKKKEVF